MESTITGTVESVTGRETSKGVIHDVVIGGKKLSAWSDSGLGEQANAMKGSSVKATYETKQNGQWTNYYLKSIELADAAPQTPTASSSIPVAAAQEFQRRMEPDVEERVTKLSCFAAACALYGATGDEDAALMFAHRLYDVAMGKQQEAVAAGVAGSPPEIKDDGIPWL